MTHEPANDWYAVRCIFRDAEIPSYEERITLWRAESFDDAIVKAEAEAADYAETVEIEYVRLAQAYLLSDEPGDGAEVFSLYRDSELAPEDYVTRFFDTGAERSA